MRLQEMQQQKQTVYHTFCKIHLNDQNRLTNEQAGEKYSKNVASNEN